MNQKLGQPTKDPLPPIQPKEAKKAENSAKNGQAFEVTFDGNSDKLKTKKYSKFSSIKKTRDIRLASEKIDERYFFQILKLTENPRYFFLGIYQLNIPKINGFSLLQKSAFVLNCSEDKDSDFLKTSMSSQ